jgi:hypothetical protein
MMIDLVKLVEALVVVAAMLLVFSNWPGENASPEAKKAGRPVVILLLIAGIIALMYIAGPPATP